MFAIHLYHFICESVCVCGSACVYVSWWAVGIERVLYAIWCNAFPPLPLAFIDMRAIDRLTRLGYTAEWVVWTGSAGDGGGYGLSWWTEEDTVPKPHWSHINTNRWTNGNQSLVRRCNSPSKKQLVSRRGKENCAQLELGFAIYHLSRDRRLCNTTAKRIIHKFLSDFINKTQCTIIIISHWISKYNTTAVIKQLH